MTLYIEYNDLPKSPLPPQYIDFFQSHALKRGACLRKEPEGNANP